MRVRLTVLGLMMLALVSMPADARFRGSKGCMALSCGPADDTPARRGGKIFSGGNQCIPSKAVRDETATYDDELVFHMNGGRAFISHLPTPCDTLKGINTTNKLRLPTAERYCAGDKFSVLKNGSLPGLLGADTSEAERCTLGRFEPIQESMIPESLQR